MTEDKNKQTPGNSDEALLDGLFQEASQNNAEPSVDLMARVLDDAFQEQPRAGARVVSGQGWVASMLSAIGGIPGAGGLVTAGVVGLWIGVSPPEALEYNASGLWDIFGTDLTASWSGYEDLL